MKININNLQKVKTYMGDTSISQENIAKSVSSEKYNSQQQLIDYLKSGVDFAAIAELNHDVFSGQLIPYEALILTDGKYQWTSELIYYVENYNLKLEKEFTDYAIKEGTVKITQEDL